MVIKIELTIMMMAGQVYPIGTIHKTRNDYIGEYCPDLGISEKNVVRTPDQPEQARTNAVRSKTKQACPQVVPSYPSSFLTATWAIKQFICLDRTQFYNYI